MVSGLNLQLIIAGIVAVAAFGAGWQVNGWRMGNKLADVESQHSKLVIASQELRQQAIRAARAVEAQRQATTDAVAEAAEARRQIRDARSNDVGREIIKYVQTSPDRCDALGSEWVRIHDLAAHSTRDTVSATPNAASESHGDTRTVRTSDALLVVTDNYGHCNTYRDQLISLQEWARQIHK